MRRRFLAVAVLLSLSTFAASRLASLKPAEARMTLYQRHRWRK